MGVQETRLKVGPFTALKRLGDGPHGTSFLVRQERQRAPRVVKLLERRPDDPRTLPPERLDRLRRDVERLALDHPNLVVPTTCGVAPFEDKGDAPADTLYLVSDYVEGPDIYRFTARAAWSTILEVIVSVLRGLEALHSRGLLHGHIVAPNVIVSGQGPRKSARLTDPGLALDLVETRLLANGPRSFAPEALRGEPLDRRADLYDLGVLLFECATRAPLFQLDDPDALVRSHLEATPPKARELKRSVPVAAEALIDALLRKDPAERPPSANAVIRELNRTANKRFSTETREVGLASVLVPAFTGRGDELEDVASCAPRAPSASVAGDGGARDEGPGEPLPPVVAVSSDPGQGRTRFLQELQHRLAAPGEGAAPAWLQPPSCALAALLASLAELAGEVAPAALAAQAPFLAPLLSGAATRPSPPLGGARERQRVVEAASRLLLEVARARPLVVALDDVQAADPLLVETLRVTARDLHEARSPQADEPAEDEASDEEPVDDLPARPADAPLLVVLTLAPEELYGRAAEGALKALLALDAVREVSLEALDAGALTALLSSSLGRDPQEVRTLVQRVAEAADGSPAAGLQLLSELAETSAVPAPDGAWTPDDERIEAAFAAPDVPDVLRRRLDRLGTTEPLAPRLATALALHHPSTGAGAPVSLLARALVTPEGDVLAAARELERRGLLASWSELGDEGPRLRLAGSSVAEPLLTTVPTSEQEALHGALGRAAAALAREAEASEPAAAEQLIELAARHLLRSATPADGAAYAAAAARGALARRDPEWALGLLDRAIRSLEGGAAPAPPEDPPEAVRAVAGEELELHCQLLHAEALAALGRHGMARGAAQKAFAAARTARNPRAMARALLVMSEATMALGDPAEAKGSCEEAVRLAQGVDWRRGQVEALQARAAAEHAAGDREEALASLDEARGVAQARGERAELAGVLRDLARLRGDAGDVTGALEACEQALELDEEGDCPARLAATLRLRARLLREQGELDRALDTARRAVTAARDAQDTAGVAEGLGAVAAVLLAQGQGRAARTREEATLALWERIDDPQGVAETRVRLGRILLSLGLLPAAEGQLTQAARTFRQLDRARTAEVNAALARVHLLGGDIARARDCVDRALEDAGAAGDPRVLQEAECLRAELCLAQGDLAGAEELADRAAEEATRNALTAVECRARTVLGWARLRRGRPLDAERELREAFDLARQRGEHMLSALARLGIAQVHLVRGEPQGTLGEVEKARDVAQHQHDAQLEVLSLVALGRLHLFLGQSRRARALLDMARQRARELELGLIYPEATLLRAVALITDDVAGEPSGEAPALPPGGDRLDEAGALLDEAEKHTASRRGLRAEVDVARADLHLRRGDPSAARERAEAALEAARISGDTLLTIQAELLLSRARRDQGRHEEAMAASERALQAAEAVRDGEARAEALFNRGRARQAMGQVVAAAHDLREATSHIRGIWAALPEDLRGDYMQRPLVRQVLEAAQEVARQVEAVASASEPAPAAPAAAPAAAAPAAAAPAAAELPAEPIAPPSAETLDTLRDPLTNLFNHTFFTAQLETEIKRAQRHSRPLALLKVNIDRFKLVRELYGAKVGKRIIREVAQLLLRHVRDVDIVARYFGDEFEVLLPDTDQRGALLTSERIREAVEAHRFEHEDEKVELTLTIGVAVFPRDAKDRDAIICRADEALYNARSRGSNSVFSFGGSEELPLETSPELRELDQLMLSREGRTILSMVSRLVNQELDVDRVIELVTGMVVEATRGERGFILLKGPTGEFSFRHGRNIDDKVINTPELKISNGIAKDVADSGEAVWVQEALEDDRFRDFKSVLDLGLRSIICAPIKIGDEVLGVIYVDHNQVARNFGQEDLNFLTAIAEKVAIPIKNSKRLRETEDKLAMAEARLKTQAAQLQTKYRYDNIIGRTEAMQKVFKLLDRIVETNHSVVIHGESGTGKELIARAIHYNGPRKAKPFVAENCAALSETLLEAELFGHVKGAFTGADRDAKGLFELANGGTLFLDEIGDMSERMQKKLLRVLQEGEVRPVGGKRVFHVDVRIISASNKDLKQLVAERKFREDLYYRLNVITVNLPPLRERRDDIVLLVDHFLEKHGQAGQPRQCDRETMRQLINYDWPGNVRELENEVNRIVAMSDDVVTPDLLSPKIREGAKTASKEGNGLSKFYNRSLKDVEHEFMKEVILHTLEETNWHRTKAAKILKVPTSTLFNKMKKYGIG